jgi:hypothetical protein
MSTLVPMRVPARIGEKSGSGTLVHRQMAKITDIVNLADRATALATAVTAAAATNAAAAATAGAATTPGAAR